MKTSDLTGLALDWAVAKAEGLDVFIPAYADAPWLQIRCDGNEFRCPNWSVNWTHGGPIIDEHDIDVLRDSTGSTSEPFGARTGSMYRHPTRDVMVWGFGRGKTKLIAAMRCFVASKLGDEISIPKELLE